MRLFSASTYTIFVIVILNSCSSYRQEMFSVGGNEEKVHNAILDFVHTKKRLLKEDDYFFVFSDPRDSSVVIMGDENKISLIVDVPDWSVVHIKWNMESKTMTAIDTVRKKTIIVIDMSNSEDHPRIWFDEDAVNKSYRAFPDRIEEHNGKLFYWYTDPRPSFIDNDVIEVIYRHDYVDTLVERMFWPNHVIDDEKKGIKYSFFENELTSYRKKTTK